jgi:hypothetical protein
VMQDSMGSGMQPSMLQDAQSETIMPEGTQQKQDTQQMQSGIQMQGAQQMQGGAQMQPSMAPQNSTFTPIQKH